MKIALFVYDRPHRKSVEVLLKLWELRRLPSVVIGAPWIDLARRTDGSGRPPLRVKPRHIGLVHPHDVADRLDVPYVVAAHTDDQASEVLRANEIELGIIGGARILPAHVIDACSLAILNLHPGLIPEVRGMDALKWSVLNGCPPGVTAHLIDQQVDGGWIVLKRRVPVFSDDTWIDLSLRLEESELGLIPEALATLEELKGRSALQQVTDSTVNRAVPAEMNDELCRRFPTWRSEMSTP